MIFRFSLIFFLFCVPLMAQAKIFLYHYHYLTEAQLVAKHLESEYKIPKILIEIKEQKNPCRLTRQNAVAHLCIDHKGELFILSFNERMLRESYSIFKTGSEK